MAETACLVIPDFAASSACENPLAIADVLQTILKEMSRLGLVVLTHSGRPNIIYTCYYVKYTVHLYIAFLSEHWPRIRQLIML